MPGGRPRKPIALKITEGTFRADRDGDLAAQVQAGGSPSPPEHLAGDALEFWNQVVPGLISAGVAAACDSPALAMMCEWWARHRRFSRQLDEMTIDPGEVYRTTILCGIAWTNFDKIASRFGLTPSDRAKLSVRPSGGASKGAVPARKRG